MNKDISHFIFLLYDAMKSAGVRSLYGVYIVKDILKMKNIQEIIGKKGLEHLEKCDLILVYSDYNRVIDNYMLLALKIENISEENDIEEKLKHSIEKIKLLVECYKLGFDSLCIWHHFNKKVEEEVIRKFCSKINETISKIKLPIIHLATRITRRNIYKMFSPDEVDAGNEVSQLIQMLHNIVRDEKRLPKQHVDKEFLESREKIKRILRI